jgi:voltage-gated potassium channel
MTTHHKTIRARVFEILEPPSLSTRSAKILNGLLTVFIAVSTVEVMLESVVELESSYGNIFSVVDLLVIAVFTCEYVLRLWSVTSTDEYRDPIIGRLRFSLTPFMLIDLLAILPAYLPLILPFDLRVLRVIRFVRVFRLLKLGRYVSAVRHLVNVFRKKSPELLTALLAALMTLIICSTLVYYAEAEAQPEVFTSIPKTLWWGIVTLTTVGYGDMYPITVTGRILGGIVAVIGIGVVAVPAGIIASGLLEEMAREKKKCPHCGREI